MLTAGTELLHIVGYVTGATLYAMLLAMVARGQARADRLGLATALLGLWWNIGEMLAYAARGAGYPAAEPWLTAIAYAALGFLPAVVVHSVSRVPADERVARRTSAWLVAVMAYASAGAAAVLQFRATAIGAPLPSPAALEIVTAGLIVLSVPLVVATRGQDNSRRALWTAALAIFAISALHLGRFHGANESWAAELLGHHASIPLAFAMLYRDYRFALADMFLRHALTLLVLVAAVIATYAALEPSLAAGSQGAVMLLVGAWIATALVFPILRRLVTRFVDRVILSRANYTTLVDQIATTVEESETPQDALARACATLAPALSASAVTVETASLRAGDALAVNDVPVWTTEAPQYVIHIGPLAGGRRLLSDDLAMLDRTAGVLARRIDALRLTEERYEGMLREREIRTLATEAELKALRAQINPHFLFNALTTIGYLIQDAPPRAFDTLMRLTTLLRAVLRSEGEFTTLGRERELIACYLQIEQERFEERLQVSLDVPEELNDMPIPALIVQPLVENAIKHGIAGARSGGTVTVAARLDFSSIRPELHISVSNTGAPLTGRSSRDGSGVGLQSVERRLRCHYGNAASLSLERDATGATRAELRVPAIETEDPNAALVTGGRP
jgi:two-component system LytT family sensor kinase